MLKLCVEMQVDTSGEGWIAFDLDKTLSVYTEWKGPEHIGEPIPAMVNKLKEYVNDGKEVRIFTARVGGEDPVENETARLYIRKWCEKNLGFTVPITCTKDQGMLLLYDDRAKQVEPNTGKVVGEE